jgi:DNA-binding NarL/FixJ family response regulator
MMLLTRWGLSPDADLVYRTLLQFGPQTAGQLARDLELAPRRVQAAVDELAAGGAVSPAPDRRACGDRSQVLTAVRPETAVARLRWRRMNPPARARRRPRGKQEPPAGRSAGRSATPPARTRLELSPRELSVVRLLAAGHSDASASAKLGLSLRTIGYTVRNLMDRCQVASRFQLGLVLATVLDPPDRRAAEPPDGARDG